MAQPSPTADGSTVESRSYDAFGLPRVVNNPSGSQRGFAGAFGYQEDAESGLKLLGHRYYDPGSGRLITRDPAQEGRNWYAYCDNNLLKSFDAEGRKKTLGILVGDTSDIEPGVLSKIQQIKDEFSDDYDIRIIAANPPAIVQYYLANANANAMVGHGWPFSPRQRQSLGWRELVDGAGRKVVDAARKFWTFEAHPPSGKNVTRISPWSAAICLSGMAAFAAGCANLNPPSGDAYEWYAPSREAVARMIDGYKKSHGSWPKDETELFGHTQFEIRVRGRARPYVLSRRNVVLRARMLSGAVAKYDLSIGGLSGLLEYDGVHDKE